MPTSRPELRKGAFKRALCLLLVLGFLIVLGVVGITGCSSTVQGTWPPAVSSPYPDLVLFDQSGSPVKLSELRGKVILIEPIRMACTACQTFAGSHQYGPFGAVLPQAGLQSLDTMLSIHARGAVDRDDFQIVQIIFFNSGDNPPTTSDLKAWDRHFHLHERNILVLGAASTGDGRIASSFIPGFQLLDRDLILRADATGSTPRQDLFRELMPMIPRLLNQPADHQAALR